MDVETAYKRLDDLEETSRRLSVSLAVLKADIKQLRENYDRVKSDLATLAAPAGKDGNDGNHINKGKRP